MPPKTRTDMRAAILVYSEKFEHPTLLEVRFTDAHGLAPEIVREMQTVPREMGRDMVAELARRYGCRLMSH
jgi:hypothetical protein